MSYLADKFKKTDYLDVVDAFIEIENTFALKFKDEDLSKVNSFNDLFKLTISYLNIPKIDSCTSQQAFYKFRRAYLLTQNSNQEITPNSLLKELFSKQNRRQKIKSLELELGFKINVLQPPDWITFSLIGLFVLSCVMLFNSTYFGVIGILMSIFSLYIAFKFGNVLKFKVLSDLITSMLQKNYHFCRSTESYNPKEIEKLIIQIFIENLDLDNSKFDRNTTFS